MDSLSSTNHGIARYFHATLYNFDEYARQNVIADFHTEFRSATARCVYDDECQLFTLECSPSEGAAADELLARLIDRAIVRTADEPKSGITRFYESIPQSIGVVIHPEPALPNKPKEFLINGNAPFVEHAVHTKARHLRFFSLAELEDKLAVERTLMPRTLKAEKLISESVTCRAVKIHPQTQLYVFNGKTGGRKPVFVNLDIKPPFDGVHFPNLTDQRDIGAEDSVDEDVSASKDQMWENVGPQVPIEQWVRGVGHITADPNTARAEMPSDAKKLLAAPVNASGRIRKPQILSLLADHDVQSYANEGNGSDREENKNLFTSLLASSAQSPNQDGMMTEEHGQSFASLLASASTGIAGTARDTMNSLPRRPARGGIDEAQRDNQTTKDAPTNVRSGAASDTKGSLSGAKAATPTLVSVSSGSLVNFDAIQVSAKNALQNHIQDGLFNSYGKKFAAIDTVGLTASARDTAKWQAENHVSVQRKKKAKSKSARPVASRKTHDESSAGSSIAATAENIKNSRSILPQISLSNHKLALEYEHDDIVERLQHMPPDFTTKRHTMSQKAHAKKKNSANLQRQQNARKRELPLPSNPPPLKPGKKSLYPEPERSQPNTAANGGESADQPASTVANPAFMQFVAKAHERQTHHFADAVECSDSDDDVAFPTNIKLIAEIGALFTTPDEDISSHPTSKPSQAMKPQVLQRLLNERSGSWATCLNSRVTTSLHDAAYLASIRPRGLDEVESEVFYDVRVETAVGDVSLRYVFDKDGATYTVRENDTVQGMQHLHCPDHVWDAQLQLVSAAESPKQSDDVTTDLEDFLLSMQTETDSPPSFRAMYRSNSMKPKEILAVRKSIYHTRHAVSFVITEIQDLKLIRLDNDPKYNLLATAFSRDEMIQQQRLWIEARFETRELESAHVVKDLVIDMVENMDGVGMENQGPWVYQQETKRKTPPEPPRGLTGYEESGW